MGSDWKPPRYADVTSRAKERAPIPNPALPVEDQERVAGVKPSDGLILTSLIMLSVGLVVGLGSTAEALTSSTPQLLLLWLIPLASFLLMGANSLEFRANRLKLALEPLVDAPYDCAIASRDWIKVRSKLYRVNASDETLEALALLEPQVSEALIEWAGLSHGDKRTVQLSQWLEEVVVKAEALLASEQRRFELAQVELVKVRDSSPLDRALASSQLYEAEVRRVLEA